MRDHVRLRSRIAILAGLAAVPAVAATACDPPPKPEKTERTARRGADGEQARDPRPARSSRMSPARLKYYRDKAAREGKTLREVVPEHFMLPDGADEVPEGPKVRPPPEGRVKTVAGGKGATRRPDPAETPAATTPSAAPPTPAPPPPGSDDPANMVGFPGDPPWIDGYNPEEASCVSGNWCGDVDAATTISVVEASDETLGCPVRIGGVLKDGKSPIEGPEYEGLSDKPNMQGSFNAHGTELARAEKKQDDICCYHWFEYCSGRPHLSEAGPVLAETGPSTGAWSQAGAAIEEVPAAVRDRIAAAWCEDARAEHASIASFARATLELMAVGAPADLLAKCQQAGLDEVRHAQACFSLAARYGMAVDPGPLPALAPRPAGLSRLAADTFAEGCVAETIAALVAERSARDCDDGSLRATLLTIADDESQHAALAWATVRWAIETGGPEVADAVRRRATAIRPPTARRRPAADPDGTVLARHGRLDTRAHHEAATDAWGEIIDPLLAGLLT